MGQVPPTRLPRWNPVPQHSPSKALPSPPPGLTRWTPQPHLFSQIQKALCPPLFRPLLPDPSPSWLQETVTASTHQPATLQGGPGAHAGLHEAVGELGFALLPSSRTPGFFSYSVGELRPSPTRGDVRTPGTHGRAGDGRHQNTETPSKLRAEKLVPSHPQPKPAPHTAQIREEAGVRNAGWAKCTQVTLAAIWEAQEPYAT